MGQLITIGNSVGRGGSNFAVDVAKIGAALVEIGPDRGGIFGVPLSIGGLAEAIEGFQRFQSMRAKDGRVDKGGATLRKMNEVLGNVAPAPGPGPMPGPGTSGEIVRLTIPGLATSASVSAWTPIESSLMSTMKFEWTGVAASWSIHYFQLEADVVPNWFGAVVPAGLGAVDKAMLFFHPTPGQAGYRDELYKSKAGWSGVFHYMTDQMAAGFCAAATGQVLIMPLMTSGAAGSAGILPAQWRRIVGQILALIANPGFETLEPFPLSGISVASFSSGIAYSHSFRAAAGLGSDLKAIIDFDGIISTSRASSAALAGVSGIPVIRCYQTETTLAEIPVLGARNYIPLARQRWGGPWENVFGPGGNILKIHGAIPHTMMHFAARKTGIR